MSVRPHLPALALALLATGLACGALADPPESLVLVAHHRGEPDTLSPRQLQRIYLGKTTRWDGGAAVHPVMFHGEPAWTDFVREMLGRSRESFGVYWKRMVFTGKGRPPLAFDDAEALADYVRETPGAIGFLPGGTDTAGLKVVTVD